MGALGWFLAGAATGILACAMSVWIYMMFAWERGE